MSDYPSRGIERREYDDPAIGHRVIQVTCNPEFESKHAYYDICPWSSDGRYLAFASARPSDLTAPYRDNVSTDKGRICVMDTSTGEIYVLAEDAFYASHGGAWTLWFPDSHILTFRRAGGTAMIDLDTGEESRLEGCIRQISGDGTRIVGSSRKLEDTDGVCTMNPDGSDPRCVVRREQLYELTPNRDEFDLEDMTIGNFKWHPDNQHILVAMWVKPRPNVRRSVYIINRDGSECRWLTHFGHHHSWTPDGGAVLFNDDASYETGESEPRPRMHLVDFDGTNRRIVIDEPVGSHPIMNPKGEIIGDFDRDGIYAVHVAEERIERLAEFSEPFPMGHDGTHPHCTWHPDGSRLLYNSAESGHSEVYCTNIE